MRFRFFYCAVLLSIFDIYVSNLPMPEYVSNFDIRSTKYYTEMDFNDRRKSWKMLRLLALMSNNTIYEVKDFAKQLGMTQRSIYRYIEQFRNEDLTVENDGKIYSITGIGRKFSALSGLVAFTEEEARTVKALVSSLEGSNVLKADLMAKLSAVCGPGEKESAGAYRSQSRKLKTLRDAMENRCRVVLKNYESGHSRTVADRLVEPFRLSPDYEFVHAYEVGTGENKVFLVSRIGEVQLLPERWENEHLFQTSEVDVFGMAGEEIIPVKLELDILAKNILLEEYPMAGKDLHLTSTGRWILNTEVRSMNGIGRFVAGLSDRITIVKAPELMEYLREFRGNIDRLVG